MALRVGFVGRGSIGKPMARWLVAAGLETHVLDAVQAPVDELERCRPAFESLHLARASGLSEGKLEEVTRSNGNPTEPMRAFLALHKAPEATRKSGSFQAMLRSFVTLAFARESGVMLPGTGLVSQLLARVHGLEDAARR